MAVQYLDAALICFHPPALERRDLEARSMLALAERRRRARTITRGRCCPICWHDLEWCYSWQEYRCTFCSHTEPRGARKAR